MTRAEDEVADSAAVSETLPIVVTSSYSDTIRSNGKMGAWGTTVDGTASGVLAFSARFIHAEGEFYAESDGDGFFKGWSTTRPERVIVSADEGTTEFLAPDTEIIGPWPAREP